MTMLTSPTSNPSSMTTMSNRTADHSHGFTGAAVPPIPRFAKRDRSTRRHSPADALTRIGPSHHLSTISKNFASAFEERSGRVLVLSGRITDERGLVGHCGERQVIVVEVAAVG